jgi:integrase
MPNPGSQGFTNKRDKAPRGVIRYGAAWGIRYQCGRGHVHKERIGRLQSDAIDALDDRRRSRRQVPGWCPAAARALALKEAEAARALEAQRGTMAQLIEDYLVHAEHTEKLRAMQSIQVECKWILAQWGPRYVDTITASDVERLLGGLETGHSPSGRPAAPATYNRYRARVSTLFNFALEGGVITASPVKPKGYRRTPRGRLQFLADATEERAVREALSLRYRDAFTVSINTGARWGEQRSLLWRDVDLLAGTITITMSKSGRSRTVPLNSTVKNILMDLALAKLPGDSAARVFPDLPRDTERFFTKAIQAAQATLQAQGRDPSRLEDYTWHCNRHTFASRLVMAGVDLRTVQELGGWASLAMVMRYAHLAPGHLQAAVERLVPDAERLSPGFTGS